MKQNRSPSSRIQQQKVKDLHRPTLHTSAAVGLE